MRCDLRALRVESARCESQSCTRGANRSSPSSSSRRRRTPATNRSRAPSRDLKQLAPGFVSVTWGAGGSTRRKTVDLVVSIQREIGLTAMAHMTCVGAPRARTRRDARAPCARGTRERAGAARRSAEGRRELRAGGRRLLVRERTGRLRARRTRRSASAAPATPRSIPRRRTRTPTSRTWCARCDAGAEFLITQLFFDADDYTCVRRARARRRHLACRSCRASCRW